MFKQCCNSCLTTKDSLLNSKFSKSTNLLTAGTVKRAALTVTMQFADLYMHHLSPLDG